MSDETSFDCMPEEIMGNILKYVDSKEYQKLRRVSLMWNKNITNLYGAAMTVNNGNLEMALGCSYPRIVAHFQDLTLQIPMTDTGMYFMNRLTSLSLSEMIVCYNIYPVFENCIHIRKLELINFYMNRCLKQYEVSTEHPSKLLPELRSLTIKFRYRPFAEAEFKFLKTLLPFFKPLNSGIGKLETIVLESAGPGGPLEVSFNKIFQKNCFNLGNDRILFHNSPPFESEIADQFYVELIQANLNTMRHLEMADGEFSTRIKMKNFFKPEGKNTEVQFTKFEQTLMAGFRDNYQNQYRNRLTMFPFLSTQTHLSTLLILLSDGLTMENIYTIANRNAITLKSLSIWYNDYQTLDASLISQLNNLRTLKFEPIFIYRHQNWSIPEETEVEILNINHLPTSLRVLITFGSLQFLNDDDFNEEFFSNLRNLEVLKILAMPFFCSPGKTTSVMESLILRRLITWLPKLKELVLRNSRPTIQCPRITPISITYGIYNDNPDDDDTFTIGDNTRSDIDALPNEATDWIGTTPFITFQKIPFIDFNPEPDIPEANFELFQTKYYDWAPNEHAAVNNFPVYFDGVISIEPKFRENCSILD